MTFEEIRDEALQLPREERAELAADLLESLEGGTEAELDYVALWREELQRRRQAFLDGKAEFRPAAEVIAELRAKLRSNEATPGHQPDPSSRPKA